MAVTAPDRVRLTFAARQRWPDIGTRIGVVLRVDQTPIVKWRGRDGETSVPAEDLEPANV